MNYVTGNIGVALTKQIVRAADSERFTLHGPKNTYADAGVGATHEDSYVNHKVRWCATKWITSDNGKPWQLGLEDVIKQNVKPEWGLELDNVWNEAFQLAKYRGKGSKFDWHKDQYDITKTPRRKITLVVCLSDKVDYKGGEFQIKTSEEEVDTFEFDFGDFILFPADVEHRVKDLTGGLRETIVCWYR